MRPRICQGSSSPLLRCTRRHVLQSRLRAPEGALRQARGLVALEVAALLEGQRVKVHHLARRNLHEWATPGGRAVPALRHTHGLCRGGARSEKGCGAWGAQRVLDMQHVYWGALGMPRADACSLSKADAAAAHPIAHGLFDAASS